MRILRDVVVREGSKRFERRGQGRLLLDQLAVNIVPLYKEATVRHSHRSKGGHVHAYLQRGGLSHISKVIPTVNTISEKASTLGAW